jgi:hypothetical protein
MSSDWTVPVQCHTCLGASISASIAVNPACPQSRHHPPSPLPNLKLISPAFALTALPLSPPLPPPPSIPTLFPFLQPPPSPLSQQRALQCRCHPPCPTCTQFRLASTPQLTCGVSRGTRATCGGPRDGLTLDLLMIQHRLAMVACPPTGAVKFIL